MNNVSNHADKRVRKRLGTSKSAVASTFGKALLDGKKHNQFKGRFKKFLDGKAMVHHAEPIVYGNDIYWVKNSTLITAYPVPGQYRKYL